MDRYTLFSNYNATWVDSPGIKVLAKFQALMALALRAACNVLLHRRCTYREAWRTEGSMAVALKWGPADPRALEARARFLLCGCVFFSISFLNMLETLTSLIINIKRKSQTTFQMSGEVRKFGDKEWIQAAQDRGSSDPIQETSFLQWT